MTEAAQDRFYCSEDPKADDQKMHGSHSTVTRVTFSLKIIFYWYLTYIITTVDL